MKKKLLSLIILTAAIALYGCGSSNSSDTKDAAGNTEKTDAVETDTKEPEDKKENADYLAEISIKDHGTITVALDKEAAPITVENFVKLANDGFYDGLTFHRIIDGFMMQGGDPLGNGTGGSDENIKGEFKNNGVENNLSHTRGAISMARSSAKDSASSQFFIVHQDSTFLDGEYACFGYVTDGIEVVDEICENAQVTDGNGSVSKENQPVIESVKILE